MNSSMGLLGNSRSATRTTITTLIAGALLSPGAMAQVSVSRSEPPEPRYFDLDASNDGPVAARNLPTDGSVKPAADEAKRRKRFRHDKHITEIAVSLALPEDDLPPDPPYLVSESSAKHCNPGLNYSVTDPALGFYHHPIYFEQTLVERFGYSRCPLDSTLAGAHFFGNVGLLPAKVAFARPRSCWATWNRPAIRRSKDCR